MRVIPDSALQGDIIVLTETFSLDSPRVKGYYSHHVSALQGQTGRPSGGISCLVKPWLTPTEVIHKTKNLLGVRTKVGVILCTYFPPESSSFEIIDSLSSALYKIENEPTILAGDFNCRIDIKSNKTEAVKTFLEQEGLLLHNDHRLPTYVSHNGTSVIDLVFSNSKVRILKQQVLRSSMLTGVRKHLPVLSSLKTTWKTMQRRQNNQARLTRTLNIDSLKQAAYTTNQYVLRELRNGQLDNAARLIEDTIKEAIEPIGNFDRKSKPWFDAQCYAERKYVLDCLHKTGSSNINQEELQKYNSARRKYKETLKEKERNYIDMKYRKIAEEAEANPFAAQRPRQPHFNNNIEIETWEQHFSSTLNCRNLGTNIKIVAKNDPNYPPITEEEVAEIILESKKKKAPGPDGIANEHLKSSLEQMNTLWTKLFNKCLERGDIPKCWRYSKIKILYKGKGSTEDPNSYRGIALENNGFKVFTKILCNRLTELVDNSIPDSQFGFRRGRSTLHAVRNLLTDIDDALRKEKGKFFAVFIDFNKAFDLLDREILITKLERLIGRENYLTIIIRNILSDTRVVIDDGITTSNVITQTNGVLQGDPMSPVLFNIVTADVTRIIQGMDKKVVMYMYADDIVIGGPIMQEVQDAINRLSEWAMENKFTVNTKKTVQMTFRKGGKNALKDQLLLGENKLTIVNQFKYLGICLQTTRTTFSIHIKEKATAAIRAMKDIPKPEKLSLTTAMKLFRAKIIPVLTYGIELIWDQLKVSDLETIEKVKASFLKRTLGVSKFTRSRLVYVLTREDYLIQEIRNRMLLPSTTALQVALGRREQKRMDIWWEFYSTDAMTKWDWTQSNYDLRHVITRFACHGFHHAVCTNKRFHEPCDSCVCELCGDHCGRYHLQFCRKRTKSLCDYAKQT